MATETNSTEAAVSGSDAQSFAERMLQKHATVNGHGPTIEDAVDEEDILHPPPSTSHQPSPTDSSPTPILVPASEAMSEKAMGKQKAPTEPSSAETPIKGSKVPSLDTKSEELFPALGGGAKPRAQGPSMAWGAKKPASVANANGINGHAAASSNASSRPATPASGVLTPTSSNANLSSRVNTPQYMSMPGRHSERVQFAPSQLLPRNQLKKPVQDILRDVNKRSKATVEMKPGAGGVMTFEGRGPVDAVRQALKDVAKEVGSKVMLVPECNGVRTDSFPSKLSRFRFLQASGRMLSDVKELRFRQSRNEPVLRSRSPRLKRLQIHSTMMIVLRLMCRLKVMPLRLRWLGRRLSVLSMSAPRQ